MHLWKKSLFALALLSIFQVSCLAVPPTAVLHVFNTYGTNGLAAQTPTNGSYLIRDGYYSGGDSPAVEYSGSMVTCTAPDGLTMTAY